MQSSYKASKALLLMCSSIAYWLSTWAHTPTTHVRFPPAAKLFRQLNANTNIFCTVLVQNIEKRKLHRQVDSVDAWLNQESMSHVFFSVRSLYCIYESFQGKIIHAENDWIFIIVIKFRIIGLDIADGRQWLPPNSRRIITDDCLAFIHDRPPAISTLIPRLTK